jgi:hypothetical protein
MGTLIQFPPVEEEVTECACEQLHSDALNVVETTARVVSLDAVDDDPLLRVAVIALVAVGHEVPAGYVATGVLTEWLRGVDQRSEIVRFSIEIDPPPEADLPIMVTCEQHCVIYQRWAPASIFADVDRGAQS